MKILVGGCSFSVSTSKHLTWVDYLRNTPDVQVENISRVSYGQFNISEGITNQLLKSDYDYVIIQWSAVGRGYSKNELEFFKKIIEDDNLEFISYIDDYVSKNDKEGWITRIDYKLSEHRYKASLTQIYLVKQLLKSKNIPHLMFWGWEQIDNSIEEKNIDLIKEIYDDNFWRYGKHGGMKEFVIDKLGYSKSILNDNLHLTPSAQNYFYSEVVEKILNNKWKIIKKENTSLL